MKREKKNVTDDSHLPIHESFLGELQHSTQGEKVWHMEWVLSKLCFLL